MRVPRLHDPNMPTATGHEAELPSEVAHHALRVLRLQRGAPITLFDGRGHVGQAQLLDQDPKRPVHYRLTSIQYQPPVQGLRLILMQGISRGERMDFVLQKATELGVHSMVPLRTEHCGLRLETAEQRAVHWHKVVVGACEQCAQAWLPELHRPQTLEQSLESLAPLANDELRLVFLPNAQHTLPLPPSGQCPALVRVLIGPEGGFSDQEIECALSAQFSAVSLGPRILRTETAALAALAMLQTLWGDFPKLNECGEAPI